MRGVVIVWAITLIVFLVIHLAPGDPILIMKGHAEIPPEQLDLMRAKWGLDQPLAIQYLTWARNLLRGDFGRSITFGGLPVSELILIALPNTIKLNALAYLVALVIGIPAGIISAVKKYSWVDYISTSITVCGLAIPNFWLALMLIIVFSLRLEMLPATGADNWRNYLMPVTALAFGHAALILRFTRSAVLEVLGEDYVRTAHSKGLRGADVLARHVMKNAALPVITLVGYRVALLLEGAVVLETVFAWPGVGRLAVNAIFRRDYLVVQALTFLGAVFVVLVNIATDLTYAWVDPRVRGSHDR
jgi:ABC-type dipeptide/oligopeptide/nickel transport system permease component